MLWIIALVIGIAVGIYWAYEIGYSWGAYIGYPLMFVMIALIVTLIIALFCCVGGIPTERTELIDTIDIVAMQDNLGSEGYYRRIESEGKYWVLTKTDKGLKMLGYHATQTYVQYTEELPRVETYRVIPRDCVRTFLFTKEWFNTIEYIIYVPEDAGIIEDFAVDLQ